MNRWIAPLALLLTTSGCSDGCRGARARDAGRPAPAAARDAGARDAGPARLDEGAVRVVFDAWLRAQNEGDFTRYGGLYATRFSGLKRAGPRARAFDRAGWLADRRRMFAGTQRVAARDVSIDLGANTALVRFTQEYTAGDFHDIGEKHLVLVAQGASIRIAREEMLASVMVPTDAGVPSLAVGRLMPVLLHGGSPWVVLDASPRPEMASGLPSIVDRGPVVVTRKSIDASNVPEAVRALDGRAVQLYTATGLGCRGTIRELAVIRRVDVHFGTEQAWSDGDGGLRGDPTAIAQQAWELGEEGALLAARIEPPPEGCNASRWGRVADLPALPVYTRRPADPEVTAAALARFRATSSWTQLQTAYLEDPEASRAGKWDEHATARPMVGVWSTPGSPRRWVVVGASAGGGCASFSEAALGRVQAHRRRHAAPADPRLSARLLQAPRGHRHGPRRHARVPSPARASCRGRATRSGWSSVRYPSLGCDC
ncbi:MAG: nuclear transport factor 2 family protein [Polyangiales bacterium]